MSKGHIKERSAGHFALIIDLPREGEKRQQKWFSFRGTKREAQVELARLIASRETLPKNGKLTLGDYLDRWVDEQRVGATALERYKGVIRKNVIPGLGHVPLSKLTADHINRHYSQQLASGRCDGTGGLKAGSVQYQHVLLTKALRNAVTRGLLARSPMDSVEAPYAEKRIMQVLDIEQSAKLLEDAQATRLFIPVLLALTCGLRRGEIAALRWRNVDLDNGKISVVESIEQTKDILRIKRPKNGHGRVVDLPALTCAELRKHRTRQIEEFLALGAKVTQDTCVHTTLAGERVRPRTISIEWINWRQGKRPKVRLHDLRHAHATHMLQSGVHPKVASERLGHSTVAITLDICSHVLPGMGAEAAKKVGDALSKALKR
jgi:integrase